MTPKQAMENLLAQGLTKYRIAKELKIQAIMVDNYLTEKTMQMKESTANRLLDAFDIEIEENSIFYNYDNLKQNI